MFKWLWHLTGGRPMLREGFAFQDRITGEDVYYLRDKLGRKWLATNSWDTFRVAIEENTVYTPHEE